MIKIPGNVTGTGISYVYGDVNVTVNYLRTGTGNVNFTVLNAGVNQTCTDKADCNGTDNIRPCHSHSSLM